MLHLFRIINIKYALRLVCACVKGRLVSSPIVYDILQPLCISAIGCCHVAMMLSPPFCCRINGAPFRDVLFNIYHVHSFSEFLFMEMLHFKFYCVFVQYLAHIGVFFLVSHRKDDEPVAA